MRALLAASVIAVAVTVPHEPQDPPAASSPAIAALRDAVSRAAPGAEAAFWARVQRDGTPLVEPIPGDSTHVLFTFLWHGDSATHNVALVNTAIASDEPAKALLERLPGTDVWYRSYPARADARFVYELSVNDDLIPFDRVTDWGARTATFHRDPFNARVFEATIVGRGQSYAEGPRAPKDEWLAARPGVPRGTVAETTFASRLLGDTRRIWVYTPAGYDTLARRGERLPLLLTFDGGEYVGSIPTPAILDNLIAAKRIAPMVAVFVATPPPQRDVELSANDRFTDFLATELVPWMRARYRLASSPSGNVVAGSSLGGLAAAYAAYRHPELFGNVLSQSGAFMYGAEGDAEGEGFSRTVASAARRSVRFWLEAGIYEAGRYEKGVDLLTSNRHLRDVLRAKGYEVTYREFAGGHSDLNWRGGFATGLLALLHR
jgi:enterochelin esterase family protein